MNLIKKCMLALLSLLILVGCDIPTPMQRYVLTEPPEPERPVASLPKELHVRNWADRSGSGSCVHASTLFVMNWQGEYKLAKKWRMEHAGGETARSITDFYRDNKLPYTATFNGDPAFLVWVTQTRRASIIWFKPSHCVAFCGISVVNGKEYAVIQDNNAPGTFEQFPLEEFIKRWRSYGGFACTLLLKPPQAPIPWPSYVPEGQNYHAS